MYSHGSDIVGGVALAAALANEELVAAVKNLGTAGDAGEHRGVDYAPCAPQVARSASRRESATQSVSWQSPPVRRSWAATTLATAARHACSPPARGARSSTAAPFSDSARLHSLPPTDATSRAARPASVSAKAGAALRETATTFDQAYVSRSANQQSPCRGRRTSPTRYTS